MEEKIIKINNFEVNCKALIEFSSLANVLLELVKKQNEMEKKLNDQDIKINNIKKLITSRGSGGTGTSWQEKENEISNILKDDDIYNYNINFNEYNNSNSNNDLNNDIIKDSSKDENKEEENQSNNEDNSNEDNKNEDNKNEDNKNEDNKNEDIKDEDNKNVDNKNEDTNVISDNNTKNKIAENIIKEKNKDIDGNIKENQDKTDKSRPNFSEKNQVNKKDRQASNQQKEEEIINKNIAPLSSKTEDININIPNVKNNSDLVSKTLKKVVILEKKVGELITKSGEHIIIIKNMQNNKMSINENSKDIKKLNESTKKLQKDVEKIKEKLQDFNIFDMFKDSGDGNIDMAKGMVMALESKMKKRMDLFDEKYKVLSNDIFKNKEDIQNLSCALNNSKLLIEKNSKKIDELKNIHDEKESKNNEQNEKDNGEFNKKFEEMIKNLEKIESNTNNKLKELEEKLKNELINNNTGKIKEEKKKKNDKEFSLCLKEMNERISEFEKNVKQILKKLNVDEINNNLSILQKEVIKKGNQGAIDDLSDRIYIIDQLIKEINSKCDSYTLLEQKVREDNSVVTKKVESLASQFHRMSLNMNKGPKEEKTIIDFTKFIDIGTFDDNKKEINRKFDKIRISFEDILRNIEEILNKLTHTPTDKDFAQFQGVIKNMLEEFKLNCNKKYSDKYETVKNIKFLETQIKSINDQYVKKAEGQDNWLLAKKPMSNYLCASCEGVIRGELDKRCDYIPWNKYPNRDEKYRMGHGFSHMLQLVNDDIRKNVDNKEKSKEKDKNNEKEYNSDEDKKKIISEKSLLISTGVNVKLPKVRQRPRNNNNLNILDDAILDKVGASPYENVDKNQSVLDSNNDGPRIVKISKLKKITTKKKSFQEPSLNEDRFNLNIKTLPSELPSFEKRQGDFE